MPQKHSRITERGTCIWYAERLWRLAANLPIQKIAVNNVKELEQNWWFSAENSPTCKAVANHAKRIYAADLSYPIILSAEGRLMDGGHRLAKAYIVGHKTIHAVQFVVDPEPDVILAIGVSYTEWKQSQSTIH